MDQFSDFKNEESHPTGEALHSVQGQTDSQGRVGLQNPILSSLDLIQSAPIHSSISSSSNLVQGSNPSLLPMELREVGQASSNEKKPDLPNQLDPVALVGQILTELLPYIASHGGHVELVRIENAVVFIKFFGACVQCPLSFYTVTYGIERHIKVKVPWIIRVEVVED